MSRFSFLSSDRASSPLARGVLFALMATIVWSGNFVVSRGLADDVPPITMSLLRWSTAFIAVLPFAITKVKEEWHHFVAHWRYYCITSIIGISYFNTAIYMAAHTVEAINLSLIAASAPLMTMILARFYFNEAITRSRLVGIAIVLCGILLLIARGDLQQLLHLSFKTGDLLMLSAALSFSIYTLLLRKKPTGCSQVSYLAVTFGLGTLFLVPFSVWELQTGATVHFAPYVYAAILYVGLGASLFCFWCWGRAVSIIGPTKASVIYYSLPLFSGIQAVVFLGEPFTWVHAASGSLILGGLIFATREPKKGKE